QRLIGRSLRAITDLKALGENQITIDCDVIQADGGTRTASITGGYVALALACKYLVKEGVIDTFPLTAQAAAISCGVYKDVPVLDLDYPEDSEGEVDANFVMTSDGNIIEIQGTGEERSFTPDEFAELMRLAQKGCGELFEAQRDAIG
ncbi:MAG TPA: ribonuclease PH, partial [Hyphomonadaceae bacterium]|nr:ribonuclease PH [Hyphomonadaceae bacterium]